MLMRYTHLTQPIRYMMTATLSLATAVISSTALANSDASGGCHKTKQLGPEGYQKTAQLTYKLSNYFNQQNAKVVVIGRKGSHAPDKRFRAHVGMWNYTHGGFAYKNPVDSTGKDTGKWTVVHMLNICDDKSGIFKESLMQFNLSDVIEYKTAVGIPSQPLQDALYPLLQDTNFVKSMRGGSKYSSISNPFNTTFQNSNEYLLDTLVAGIAHITGENISTRKASKAYFKRSGLSKQFTPEEVRVRFHERLGSNFGLGPGNASIRDHGLIERSDGRVDMVSVGAVIQFLEKTGYLHSKAEVMLKDKAKARDTKVVDVK